MPKKESNQAPKILPISVPLEFAPFTTHSWQSEGMLLRVFWSATAPAMLFGKSACSHKPELILLSKSESLECSHKCQHSTSFLISSCVSEFWRLPITWAEPSLPACHWCTAHCLTDCRVGQYSIWVCTIITENFITIYDIIMIYRTESYTINTNNSWHVFWLKYIQQQGLHTPFVASCASLFGCSNSFTASDKCCKARATIL